MQIHINVVNWKTIIFLSVIIPLLFIHLFAQTDSL